MRPDLRAADLVSVTVRRDGALAEAPVVLQNYEPRPPPLRGLWRVVSGRRRRSSGLRLSPSSSGPGRRGAPPRLGRGVLGDLPFLLGLSPLDVVLRGPFWAYAGATFIAYMLLWAGGLHFALVFPRPAPSLPTAVGDPAHLCRDLRRTCARAGIAGLVLPDGLSLDQRGGHGPVLDRLTDHCPHRRGRRRRLAQGHGRRTSDPALDRHHGDLSAWR